MRRIRNAILALALVGALATPAMASADEGPPPHGHIFVLGVEFGPTGITYRKCLELANGQALPLNAHHEHVHTGRAGEALRDNAGNFPIPMFAIPDCAHLAEELGPPTN